MLDIGQQISAARAAWHRAGHDLLGLIQDGVGCLIAPGPLNFIRQKLVGDVCQQMEFAP